MATMERELMALCKWTNWTAEIRTLRNGVELYRGAVRLPDHLAPQPTGDGRMSYDESAIIAYYIDQYDKELDE